MRAQPREGPGQTISPVTFLTLADDDHVARREEMKSVPDEIVSSRVFYELYTVEDDDKE